MMGPLVYLTWTMCEWRNIVLMSQAQILALRDFSLPVTNANNLQLAIKPVYGIPLGRRNIQYKYIRQTKQQFADLDLQTHTFISLSALTIKSFGGLILSSGLPK